MDWPEITKDTPLEEIKRIHQQIWQYVVENGEKPDTPYASSCVLCEYALILKYCYHSNRARCDFCPVIWTNDELNNACFCSHSPYTNWYPKQHPHYTEYCIEYAKKIRDIPFKYELETKGAEE